MNLFGKKIWLALVGVLCLIIYACGDKNKTEVEPGADFDKTAMLTNYADNLIIPGYTSLQQKLQTLETATNTFLATPTEPNQQALKPVFKEAYLQFQRVSVYQLGPAETVLLNNFLNTLPATVQNTSAAPTTRIENNISSGNYNLAENLRAPEQGFPALDYLLFSGDAVQKLNQTGSANRKQYVQNVITRMKTLVGTVLTSWNTGYRAEFIGNTRTDVGSPIGFLVNQFAFEMDQLKGPRIGLPYGKQSGGTMFVDKVEAYYAGISVALAVENLTSLKKAYTGNGTGKGLSDYLVALNKAQLNTDVLNQFDIALAKLQAIPDPLATAFTTQKDKVDAAYRDIQTLLTLLKTDVASATGVRITYQDSDGD